MSVPFMLSIDYLHINAHPYLPPTRLGLRVSGYACACYALTGRSGFGYYFHFTPGLPSSPCGLRRDRYALGYGKCRPIGLRIPRAFSPTNSNLLISFEFLEVPELQFCYNISYLLAYKRTDSPRLQPPENGEKVWSGPPAW